MITPSALLALVLSLALATALGALLTWLSLRPRLRQAEDRAQQERTRLETLQADLTREVSRRAAAEASARQVESLEAELEARELQRLNAQERILQLSAHNAELTTALEETRASTGEKLALLEEARARLAESFRALSAEALRGNSQAFLELAQASLEQTQARARGELELRQQAMDALVRPVHASLETLGQRLQSLEEARVGAFASLETQLRGLAEAERELRQETGQLARALRVPSVRGRWGELQLRRVVELAGMLEHSDFSQQVSAQDESRLRPDLVVWLPGGRCLVVDAKVPLTGYLAAVEAVDEGTRRTRMQEHARQVRHHLEALAKKAYWEHFDQSLELVVLFLPGEALFSAALEQDPGLLEAGAERRVILATPTTLIALLRSVAFGWRQERLTRNARAISQAGSELYQRLSELIPSLQRTGRALGQAVEAYNRSMGSLESRVMVSARRLGELNGQGQGLEGPGPLGVVPRGTLSVEALGPGEDLGVPSANPRGEEAAKEAASAPERRPEGGATTKGTA